MPWRPKRDHPVTRVFFLLVGLSALSITAWQSILLAHLLQRGVRVTGHIVGPIADPAAKESGAHPTIQFTALTGAGFEFHQNGMGSRHIGAPIPVLYDPAAPASTATADAFLQLWYPVLLPLFFGVAFTLASCTGEIVPARGGYRGF